MLSSKNTARFDNPPSNRPQSPSTKPSSVVQAKKRRNNNQQRPGSSLFVNFAVNRDARLRDALKTAMREVAAVDYKAIAQHFNNQFATEDPPIMTSAGYVQAYMDREERSMSMSVTAGPGVPASMSGLIFMR